jgi:hypothetical protein
LRLSTTDRILPLPLSQYCNLSCVAVSASAGKKIKPFARKSAGIIFPSSPLALMSSVILYSRSKEVPSLAPPITAPPAAATLVFI